MKTWFQALRIEHWVKNFFVLAPFLFGPNFGFNEFLFRSLEGTFLFCLMSSAVYLFNDIVDVLADQKHPVKQHRPIAAGKISPVLAGCVCAGMVVLSILFAVPLGFPFVLILCLYAANNLLYSFFLKRKTVIDVISIAIGFVMRIYAGGVLVDLEVTHWLIVCVFSLSLMMGFGKRRAEFQDLREEAHSTREVNANYSIPKLNVVIGSSASITIVAYILYAVSPETKALHGTDKIIFTTPLVVYCIYRFILKVQEGGRGEPVELITGDRGFLLAGLIWLISTIFIMH